MPYNGPTIAQSASGDAEIGNPPSYQSAGGHDWYRLVKSYSVPGEAMLMAKRDVKMIPGKLYRAGCFLVR